MRSAQAPGNALPDTPFRRAIETGAAVAAAGSWAAVVLLEPATATLPSALVAATSTAVAVLLPWSRRRTEAAFRAVTAVAESERTRAVDDAAAHAARWQAVVDTATEGIVSIDASGTIEMLNGAAERLFGYAASELVGKNVSTLMPPPYCDEHDGYLHRYVTTGVKRIIGIGREVVGLRKDGTMFPIDLSVGEGWTNGTRFFTAVVRDITDRKEMQTKLAQTERLAAVGELAAGVAHEVNNPINTVINCAQLIRDGDDPNENCQVIIEEGQRIAEIVQDLLQFARDDRDRAQPTALPEVVQRTLRLMGENFKRHGITLQVDVADDLPQVKARPQQIQQVLLNLLINAKDALIQEGRDPRRVALSAAPAQNGVRLSVQDNGPGIPEHLGAHIFEPFVTTKRAKGGTGLGLSISKSIVEGYGGTIEVDSTPGRGATFHVWLPLADRTE